MKINEYLTIKQAADLLGVTMNTLRNWEEAGKIKCVRNPMNRYRLYKKKDLEELLKDVEGEPIGNKTG